MIRGERWAMKGQGVCAMHGGKTPAALAKAQAAIERADMKILGLAIPAVDVIERLQALDGWVWDAR